ncbi:MAG: hypothetical protein RLZ12_562 [Bacillota bacterium]|jgi:2-oxoisovalerate dehydrogenase E1 component alpha subunit
MSDEGLLTKEELQQIYYFMLLGRKLDELVWQLNRAGKVPFAVSCQGHEAAQAGTALAFKRELDWLCPYYRDLVLVLMWGQSPRDHLLSVLAKAEEPNSAGRQMPSHFGDRRYRILSGSSPVATQASHAVGLAYAARMKKSEAVVLTSCGDGSINQGEWHEACNFAGTHRLPVIFLVENNGYAISVPYTKQTGGQIFNRAIGYGFHGVQVDGTDPLAVYQEMRNAVQRARTGEGPTLVEAKVPRLKPHSTDDDERLYRGEQELMQARELDPVLLFKKRLEGQGFWQEAEEQALVAKIQLSLKEALNYAEQADAPDPNTIAKHLFAESAAVTSK